MNPARSPSPRGFDEVRRHLCRLRRKVQISEVGADDDPVHYGENNENALTGADNELDNYYNENAVDLDDSADLDSESCLDRTPPPLSFPQQSLTTIGKSCPRCLLYRNLGQRS